MEALSKKAVEVVELSSISGHSSRKSAIAVA
jgi:hypothetical protein